MSKSRAIVVSAFLLVAAGSVFGQGYTFWYSGLGFTYGATDPATCTPNVTVDNWNTTATAAWHYCSATNTWAAGRSLSGNLSLGAGGVVTSPDPFAVTKVYVAGGGTAQAQTYTISTGVTSLAAGLSFCWLPAAANTGAAPTMTVTGGSAFAAKPITKLGTTALVANDITTTAVACVVYDGTEFQLQNPQTTSGMTYPGAGVPVSTGSSWSTSKATPTGVLVGDTDTQTLTNKTVDGASPTELGYVAGVTSAIQTQLNAKAASNAATTVNGQTCTLGSTCTISTDHGSHLVGNSSAIASTVYLGPQLGNATNSTAAFVSHGQTYTGIYCVASAAPGTTSSGKAWTMALNVNGGGADSGLTCQIFETATTCSATGSVGTTALTSINSVHATAVSTPGSARLYCEVTW